MLQITLIMLSQLINRISDRIEDVPKYMNSGRYKWDLKTFKLQRRKFKVHCRNFPYEICSAPQSMLYKAFANWLQSVQKTLLKTGPGNKIKVFAATKLQHMFMEDRCDIVAAISCHMYTQLHSVSDLLSWSDFNRHKNEF